MNTTGKINIELQQRVLCTIQSNHLIEQGDGVVVGVSGGPDSVCLLHVLHSLSETLGMKLYAVHINHMLRAEEALADEDYTSELCKGLGIPLSIIRTDVSAVAEKLGMSVEEAGREVRYREFGAYAREVGAARIAVAHSRNDQAETVMMHIIRGSGTAGLTGMEFKRGAVIRPLLDIGRSEIEQYCKASGLSPRTDSSNLKCDYTRNRVRLELFPYIDRSFGADIVEGLCRLSSHAADDNSFLDQYAGEAYRVCLIKPDAGIRDVRSESASGEVSIPGSRVSLVLEKLNELHPAILGRVLKLAVCSAAGSSTGIGSTHYQALAGLIHSGKTGSRAELPRGLRAQVSYGRIDIYAEEHPAASRKTGTMPTFERELSVPGITQVPELNAAVAAQVEIAENIDNHGKIGYNSLVQFFDYDSLNRGINIRNRRDGDVFKPLRSNGTKKLKEYFIDEKIPREIRDGIPLVSNGKEIVWVIGHKISDKFKVTENTKSILKLEYSRRTSL